MARRVLIVGASPGLPRPRRDSGSSTGARNRPCSIAALRLVRQLRAALCSGQRHLRQAGCSWPRVRRFATASSIDVRSEHGGPAHRSGYEPSVRDLRTGEGATRLTPWFCLGASPISLCPASIYPGVFVVRTIPDSRRIRAWLSRRAAKPWWWWAAASSASGWPKNLVERDLSVTVVERKLPQVMPPYDAGWPRRSRPTSAARGGSALGEGPSRHPNMTGRLVVVTEGDQRIAADLVVLSIGVRPGGAGAGRPGLVIGGAEGIAVDDRMRTSDPAIYARWATPSRCATLSSGRSSCPSNPPNRRGRIAARAIAGAPPASAACGARRSASSGVTAGTTGASEGPAPRGHLRLRRRLPAPGHPRATTRRPPHPIKLIFSLGDGRIPRGAGRGEGRRQAPRRHRDDDPDARQRARSGRAELCYAPQYGSAKDPVNVAGMMACNALRGDIPLADWGALGCKPTSSTCAARRVRKEPMDGATNLPLSQLRKREAECHRDRQVWVYCATGTARVLRAQRLLRRRSRHFISPGGYTTWKALRDAGEA